MAEADTREEAEELASAIAGALSAAGYRVLGACVTEQVVLEVTIGDSVSVAEPRRTYLVVVSLGSARDIGPPSPSTGG